jgi:hypothetical protein
MKTKTYRPALQAIVLSKTSTAPTIWAAAALLLVMMVFVRPAKAANQKAAVNSGCAIIVAAPERTITVKGDALRPLYKYLQTTGKYKEDRKDTEVQRPLDESIFGYEVDRMRFRFHVDNARTQTTTEYSMSVSSMAVADMEKLSQHVKGLVNVRLNSYMELQAAQRLIEAALIENAFVLDGDETYLLNKLLDTKDWQALLPDFTSPNAKPVMAQLSQKILNAAQKTDKETLARTQKLVGRLLKYGLLKAEHAKR